MISQFLRREFDSGGAGFYVFIVTPAALLAAFVFPPSFAPFIMAAAFFPVYFYFTRRENHFKAVLCLAMWAMMEFSELSFAVSFNPDAVGAALGLTEPNPLRVAFGWRMADLVYSSALSLVSGGAFFLVKAAVKINDSAFHFGSFLYADNLAGAFIRWRRGNSSPVWATFWRRKAPPPFSTPSLKAGMLTGKRPHG